MYRDPVSADAISIIGLLRISRSHECGSWVVVPCDRPTLVAGQSGQQALLSGSASVQSNPSLRPAPGFTTHSLTAALDQLRAVASSTSNDPGPQSRQHQQIGQRLLPLAGFTAATKCDLCSCPSNLLIHWPSDMNIYKIGVCVSLMARFPRRLPLCLSFCL